MGVGPGILVGVGVAVAPPPTGSRSRHRLCRNRAVHLHRLVAFLMLRQVAVCRRKVVARLRQSEVLSSILDDETNLYSFARYSTAEAASMPTAGRCSR